MKVKTTDIAAKGVVTGSSAFHLSVKEEAEET